MKRFSARKGLTPAQKIAQVESIDEDLRTRLWSALYDYELAYMDQTDQFDAFTPAARTANRLGRRIWTDFFKHPSDALPARWDLRRAISEHFRDAKWFRVYDLVEFCLDVLPPISSEPLAKRWNVLLEEENAGYRLVDDLVVDITSPEEIAEIEASLTSDISTAREHISTALTLLTVRKDPDYRNSIKESISAVESVCKQFSKEKALSDALKTLRDKIGLHPALEKGFNALYGYTSDHSGIRHALLQESTVDAADARFMLVACSAFINFVVSKASKVGLKLET